MLVSLFCGPGGMDEGFRQAGFSTALAYDIDPASISTFRENHPNTTVERVDLSLIETDDIISLWNKIQPGHPPFGIIGGPPCQSFSVSNVHDDDDDPRHKLPEHYARILAGLNQEYGLHFFVFENVPGLVTIRHIAKFERFKQLFEEAGFKIFEESLDAQWFGVAQTRARIFVVGINRRIYPEIDFKFPVPTSTEPLNVRRVIGHLPEPIWFNQKPRQADIPCHPNHVCMTPKSEKFRNGMLQPGRTVGRSFRVLSWDRPSYTVAYGHREVHVHPNLTRRLSVFEAMLLQGFPENYILKGTLSDQIRLVSEAVAPPVARAIAGAIARQLKIPRLA